MLLSRPRRVAVEFAGSAALALVVIGSGIMAQRLTAGQVGVQLLENAVATAAGLFVIITVLAPASGAHLNPVVSLVETFRRRMQWRDTALYCVAQVAGCVVGAMVANVMFSLPVINVSTNNRSSAAHFLSEVVATAGLVLVIFVLAERHQQHLIAASVACYIGSAYFFTSSTSFANPAIVVGRMFSNTFAGIAPASAPLFIGAELLGGAVGVLFLMTLFQPASEVKEERS